MAPSAPDCKIQGTAQYGQDITLSCLSAEGSPPPTYSWERRNVQNQPVPQPPKTTDSKQHIDPGKLMSHMSTKSFTNHCKNHCGYHSDAPHLTVQVALPFVT